MGLTLHLVRHLAPQVPGGVCYGRTDVGVEPALLAAALPALRALLPSTLPVYASPLQRCALLAAALYGDAVSYDARLAELDFGSWEMRAWDTIARAEIDAWAADTALFRPGGGESVYDMAVRVAAFYDALPGDAIVICHAGTIRLLSARARGLDPLRMAREAAATPHAIGYGEIVRVHGV